jgi:hypothetical protein
MNVAKGKTTMQKHFNDISEAREAIRELIRSDGLPPGSLDVCLAGGRYELEAPLVVGLEDSGTGE